MGTGASSQQSRALMGEVNDERPTLPHGASGPAWNLITRVITPVIFQNDVAGSSGSQLGLGDMVPTFFLSPSAPTASGIIWGAGPVLLLPTATHDMLGGRRFGLGPSAVVLKQDGPWTVGALVNHIWSVAGDDDRPDVNSTFLQPFISYSTKTAASFAVAMEATQDANAGTWSVPVNANASQVLKLGSQVISIGGGLRYWMESPSGGPSGIGFRGTLTFMFPA